MSSKILNRQCLAKFNICMLLLAGMLSSEYVFAQTQRALIIGINTYKPPLSAPVVAGPRTWTNLDGCVNDATAMRDLAISKYSFKPENISFLLN